MLQASRATSRAVRLAGHLGTDLCGCSNGACPDATDSPVPGMWSTERHPVPSQAMTEAHVVRQRDLAPGAERRRSPYLPMLVGTLAAGVFVLLEGHTHVVPGVVPPSRWFGLLDVVGPGQRALDSLVAWFAILTLGACWLMLARQALAGRLRLRVGVVAAVAWAVPFTAGPPLTSLDMYSYAAHGWLSSSGLSPYGFPPAALGPGPVLGAVDPRWRNVLSPYGPGGTLLEHVAAVVGRTPLGTVLMLRLFAVVAAVAAVGIAVALTRPSARPRTLVLLGLNPLLLTTTFSAAHLEAMVLAALLGALYFSRRNRPLLALALAVTAGLVKAPALAAVPFLVVENWRNTEARLRVAVRDITVVAAALIVGGALVPNGWAWTGTVVHTPATGREWWTPSTLLAEMIAGIGRGVGVDVGTAGLLGLTRTAGLLASGFVLAHLLRKRGDVALRLGIGLSSLAVLGFVLYPWYLLWGWPLLVIAGRRRVAFVSSVAAAAFTLANLWPQRREAAALVHSVSRHLVPTFTAAVLALPLLILMGWLIARMLGSTSEQAASADDVMTGVGSVQTDPPVRIEDPGALGPDGRAKRQRATPTHAEEDRAGPADVDAQAARSGPSEGGAVGEQRRVSHLVQGPMLAPPHRP
jgi:hypothetical protein